MELFQKKLGPVFLKENSDAELFIEKMTELSKRANGSIKEEIDNQIKLATFFLENSIENKSDYLKKYESMVEELNKIGDKVKKCKSCGGVMKLRTAKKGANVGKQFWGCERFPECKYVESAEDN